MRAIGILLAATALLVGCTHHGEIAARAAAMRDQLPDYRVIEGKTSTDDGTSAWAAHFDLEGIHYIRERAPREDFGMADNEYWFEERNLFAYSSRATRMADLETVALFLGFDRAGGLAERSKTLDGRPEAVLPAEVAAVKRRANLLELDAERTLLIHERDATTPSFATQERVGRMTLEGDRLRFLACGEKGPGTVIQDFPDARGTTLIRDLGGSGMVLVRLDEERLKEIRYAASEGPGCKSLPPDGDVEARGNEPFWYVRVDGARAVWRTPSDPDGAVFRDGMWSRSGEGPYVFRARRGSASGVEHLTLELTEARCVDSMSGARYPMKAVAKREGERVEGCAVEGKGRAATDAR
jgi:uncharacterized membrane protein